jgi:glycosyltransferase involved in cell wall biosynthesis
MFLLALVSFPRAVVETCRMIRAERPDLVHINSAVLVPSAVGARISRVPLVWHIREAAHSGHFGLRLALLRAAVRRLPDRVISICRDNAERLGLNSTKARVIYNFVDFRRFDRRLDSAAIRSELRLPPGNKVLLYCGGTSVIKGASVLPKALRILRERFPGVVCLVSGYRVPPGFPGRRWVPEFMRGEQRRLVAINAEYDRLEQEGMVLNVGFRSDIERLIAACDVLLFPATVPHFARPVMEAEAMGKPVVASELGGVTEIVQRGIQGELVPAGDPGALAGACGALLSNPERCQAMGEAGYQFARVHFDAETNVRLVTDLYRELLSCRGCSGGGV